MWRPIMLTLGLALLTRVTLAQTEDRPRLSDQGRTVVGGTIDGYWSNGAADRPGGRDADWAVEVTPSWTYFLWQRVGIGVYGGYGLERYGIWEYDRISTGLQCVSELKLGPRLGLFLWALVGYDQNRLRYRGQTSSFFSSTDRGVMVQQQSPYSGIDVVEHAIDAALFIPLTVHLSEAVGIGFGPRVHWQGYFGGDEPSTIDFNRVRLGAGTWIGASF